MVIECIMDNHFINIIMVIVFDRYFMVNFSHKFTQKLLYLPTIKYLVNVQEYFSILLNL